MLILIKSYKRPYLLEFTIQSIIKNVVGEYFIVVIDDGTPQVYLDKIKKRYHQVSIEKSAYYEKKSRIDGNLLNQDKKLILPHSDWNFYVKKYATDYFLILEDDQFVSEKLDLIELKVKCVQSNLNLLHFNVLNKYIQNSSTNNSILIYQGSEYLKDSLKFLFITSTFIFIRIIRKLFSIIFNQKNLFNFKRDALPIYSLYVISGGIYKKEYFLYCNKDSKDELDEFFQLRKAIKYNLLNFGMLFFAVTYQQKIKTSFCSTVVSGSRNTKFDPFKFNQLLNYTWSNEDFKYFDTINWDVDYNYVCNLLDSCDNFNSSEIWINYSNEFKNNYKNIGFRL
jgi:hypothetical protein